MHDNNKTYSICNVLRAGPSRRKSRTAGFTIVELLIVIVVIGILAAITIVAYNGVQNRANDVVIQSDLRGLAQEVLIYEANNGAYPPAGQRSGYSQNFPGITFQVSRGAYSLIVDNLSYCEGTISGTPTYAFRAKSKSGNVFSYSSTGGLKALGNVGQNSTTACNGIDSGTTGYSYGYNYGSSLGWSSWTTK